ncbi:hypothetical protein HJFPF1_11159 [Paramyrothecium foliicola]|nr:hypothetical protein HJFPF1_11159 [Paramyrothecium foliicola]
MPKHSRNASGSRSQSQSQYQNLPVSLAPSPLYTQQRMAMPANYYALASSAGPSAMPLAPQQQQQPSYDPYSATSTAPPVSLPPAQHRASSGAWTPADDQQLLAARMQGLNWAQIKETYFPTKTGNACRKRHERLMERKGADDWDNRKMQRLAKEYMGMRKEIWSGLAARTGEKWNVVEQKCMSNGLKNLQSAARAASRRDRLEAGAALSGYDDDSGISGIGLTPVDELDASYSSPETSSSGPHSASSASGYHHLPPHHHQQHLHPHAHHAHMQSLAAAGHPGYAMAAGYTGGGGYHGYSSSVSSSASHHRYSPHGTSQSSSPYLHGQRQPSVDMGIEAIINRPGGHGV